MNNANQGSHRSSILVWNVQGTASGQFLCPLKELIRRYSPNNLVLLETKISGHSAYEVCMRIHNEKFKVDANGFCAIMRCLSFNHWIENKGFIDLSHGRSPKTRKYARLDKGMCNQQWRLQFPKASVHLNAYLKTRSKTSHSTHFFPTWLMLWTNRIKKFLATDLEGNKKFGGDLKGYRKS
ncbi:hypothetical protein Cgig2_001095 [Carnegiea gigantea]|uniref:Uncharacterized protein n=1 Tax=Carnegiea gigantea TaxID=171969 RepID=A0A9Q1JV47_9CARY|nr:hypothetical protein Cgig2_001095 [Carnegiea gigantea]